jgi:hypothetical protein
MGSSENTTSRDVKYIYHSPPLECNAFLPIHPFSVVVSHCPHIFTDTMKITSGLLLALPALSSAFPSMIGGASSRTEIEDMLRAEIKREAEAEAAADPQLLNPVGNLLGALGGVVSGLLNSVGQAIVVKSNKRPEPGYTFKAPGPGDSRGPCPALNLLANYGYLPRNGYVSYGEILDATARGFNMGADLSAVLATFAVLANGDLDNLRFYLGAGKNGVGGLNRHSTVEADISPNREGTFISHLVITLY